MGYYVYYTYDLPLGGKLTHGQRQRLNAKIVDFLETAHVALRRYLLAPDVWVDESDFLQFGIRTYPQDNGSCEGESADREWVAAVWQYVLMPAGYTLDYGSIEWDGEGTEDLGRMDWIAGSLYRRYWELPHIDAAEEYVAEFTRITPKED